MKNGFTLVELIIVIVIVGILAALGLSQYSKVMERGRAAEARMILGNLRGAEVAYNAEKGFYTTVANLSIDAPTACTPTHYFSYFCESGYGRCTATRCTAGQGGKNPPGATAFTKTLDINGIWTGAKGY